MNTPENGSPELSSLPGPWDSPPRAKPKARSAASRVEACVFEKYGLRC